MDMVMTLTMMLTTIMMVAVEAAIAMDGDMDVDVLGGGLTSLGAPPSLSEPPDQPYPTQPYATKLLQFHSFINCDTTPYKFPTVGAGDGAMGREMPCQGHRTTVQPYNGTMVRCMTYDKYNVWCMTYDRYNVQRTTVRHGHTH